MPAAVPGQFNTYIANHEATNGLIADYSRNPNRFPFAQYMQYIPVEKNRGHYIEMTVEMAGRIRTTDGSENDWPDANQAPTGVGNLEEFEYKDYRSKRKAYPYSLGELAAEQASWDVLAQHGRIWAQNAMTVRTKNGVNLMLNDSIYPTGHVIDVTSPPAQLTGIVQFDLATTSDMSIKKTLDYAFRQIQLQTLSAVEQQDVMIVLDPVTAALMSVSQELRDTLKQSPFAMGQVESNLDGDSYKNQGLPDKLYGYKVVVENSVEVTTPMRAATPNKQFLWGTGNIVMCSRPGGLEGHDGPNFSSFCCFLKEEMTVESKHDIDNRRHMGRVVDDFAVNAVSPISAVKISDAISVA